MREPKIYPPGWFLAPALDWWPDFSSLTCSPGQCSMLSSLQQASALKGLQAGRQARAEGRGWAAGTVVMPKTPTWKAPTDMERR